MLPGIELKLPLPSLLVLLDKQVNLLVLELLAIKPLVHPSNVLSLLLHGLLFLLLRSSCLVLSEAGHYLFLCRLNVVEWSVEVDVDVGFDDADLVLGLAVDDVDLVVPASVVDVDRVALEHAGVVR